jgi:predicted aspartyl protease
MPKLIRRALGVIIAIGVGVHVGHVIVMSNAAHAPSSQAALTVDDLGVYTVSASLSGGLPQTFIVDSGAASVVIPRSMLPRLIADGKVKLTTKAPDKTQLTVADGRKIGGTIYTLRSVTIAGQTIDDVPCVVTDGDKDGLPLLGQSVLGRFNRWSIDNVHHTLTVA